jgi:hypothetical protein
VWCPGAADLVQGFMLYGGVRPSCTLTNPRYCDPISAAGSLKGQEETSAAIYSSGVTFNEPMP